MKTIVSLALSLCAAALITACGGTKNTAAVAPASSGEFDSSTGTWQPLTKVVTPPPPQGGAVIVAQKKPSVMKKIGTSVSQTLKKPLQWVGLGKDEPQPVSAEKPASQP